MQTQTLLEPVEQTARDIVARTKEDARLWDTETPEQRRKREYDESEAAKVLNQLGRIEEIRAELARASENYRHSSGQSFQRLQAMIGPHAPAEVNKAAKAVADAFDIPLSNAGLKQPPTPKKHSPFED